MTEDDPFKYTDAQWRRMEAIVERAGGAMLLSSRQNATSSSSATSSARRNAAHPSRLIKPASWSACRCVIRTAPTSIGLIPSVARLGSSRPASGVMSA